MAGGRPSKPIQLVKGHRTKSERTTRAKAEAELLTGLTLKESRDVRDNPVAHKEFARIRKLLKSIKRDDDLYGHVLNTHCLLVAECQEIETTKAIFTKTLEDFEDRLTHDELSFSEEMRMRMALQGQILACDKALMAKRKMLLDIGKENILTIASALRSIPKKKNDEDEDDPMARLLGG